MPARQFCRSFPKIQLVRASMRVRSQTWTHGYRMRAQKSSRLRMEKEVRHFRWLTLVRNWAGLSGVPVTECAYVESSVQPGLPYFASKVVFGKDGVEKVLPVGNLSEHEKTRLAELTPILKGEIDDGLEYAKTRQFAK